MYPKSLNACSQIYPKTPLYLTSKSTRFTVLYDCLPNFQARSLEVMPLTSREIARNHNHNYSYLFQVMQEWSIPCVILNIRSISYIILNSNWTQKHCLLFTTFMTRFIGKLHQVYSSLTINVVSVGHHFTIILRCKFSPSNLNFWSAIVKMVSNCWLCWCFIDLVNFNL